MLVRLADETAAVKTQAKAAAAKFSERARAEKCSLQAEIKQLQVGGPNATHFQAVGAFDFKLMFL